MKAKQNKIYVVTDSNGRPKTFGAGGKLAWRTVRHVMYHLTRRHARIERCKVLEIDLHSGVMASQSVISFIENHRNPEAIKESIAKEFGFIGIDLSGLESLYRLNVLERSVHEKVGNFLIDRGIIGATEHAVHNLSRS